MIALSCGPHGAGVVGERVIRDVVRGQRPDPPPGPEVVGEEAAGQPGGTVVGHDPRLQQVARVRGDALDRPLRPVQPEVVRVLGVPPEALVEPVEQVHGLAPQPCGVRVPAEELEQVRRSELRVVHVALQLDERDRRLGEAAVAVGHGVARVLPALVRVAVRRPGRVLLQPIAVAIAGAVDPAQRRVHVRQVAPDRLDVAQPVEQVRDDDRGTATSRRACRSRACTAGPRWRPARRAGSRAGSCPAPCRARGRPRSPAARRAAAARPGRTRDSRRSRASTRSACRARTPSRTTARPPRGPPRPARRSDPRGAATRGRGPPGTRRGGRSRWGSRSRRPAAG